MEYFKRLFIIFVLSILSFSFLCAQIASVAITVMDEEEFVPVSKAQIKVSDVGTKYTNFYGRSQFESLKKGSYFISIKHPAYETFEKVYFIVDTWKELQVYLTRSKHQKTLQENIASVPASKKDYKTASILRKFGYASPFTLFPDIRYLNKLIVHLSQDPSTQMFLESNYYVSANQAKKNSVDLGDAVDLINNLNNYNTPQTGKEEDNIEYILGQPINASDVNLNDLLFKKKKRTKAHRNVGILTVVAGDIDGKPVKGIPISIYSMKNGKLLGEKKTDSFGRVIFYEIPKIRVKVRTGDETKIIPILKTYTLCDFIIKKTVEVKPEKKLYQPVVKVETLLKLAIKKEVTNTKTPEVFSSQPSSKITAPITLKTKSKPAVGTKEAASTDKKGKNKNEWVEIKTKSKAQSMTVEIKKNLIKIDRNKKFKW